MSEKQEFCLTRKQKRYLRGKRVADILFSGVALLLFLPFALLIAVIIKCDSPGPVFFKQRRVGKDKSYFEIWKFRSMYADTRKNVPTHLLEDPEKYITRVGRILRKTSLDEVPQLLNIFKGDMSFVGPRPALWNQYDLIEERDKYGVHGVLPGLTGWAQINGRDTLEIAEKARLDGEYVKNIGLSMDLKCFLGTFGPVLKRKDVIEGLVWELKDTDGKAEADENGRNR